MMLESIEKLRDWATRPDGSFWRPEIREFSDAIEREISERYMPLPLDADGVPIHVGDSVEYPSGVCDDVRFITIYNNAFWINEGEWLASKCRHVKTRTVEDVLREFAESGTPTGEGGVLFETALIEKYADELRDLFGGDVQ